MKTSARVLAIVIALIMTSALEPADATRIPRSRVQPTGCSHDSFDAGIETHPTWGVVPFSVVLEAVVESGQDFVDSTYWDFDGDGLADASGTTVTHSFIIPEDCYITARFVTRYHGTLVREVIVSAHSALMSITFDDGHCSIFAEALPLLESKGVKGTAYIVPGWIDSLSYMSWAEVSSLQASGWDIGSHSMTHRRLTEVDDSTLHYELRQSQTELQSRGFPAKHFAVPYYAYDDHVIEAIKLYYESCRIDGGLNPRVDEVYPYGLKSYESLSWKGFQYYQAHIDSVVAVGGWYILNNHLIGGGCGTYPWCITDQMLSDIIDYAILHRVRIVNVDQALASRENNRGISVRAESGKGFTLETESSMAFVQITACPEPFGSAAAISYRLSKSADVIVSVYSPRGRHVQTLANDHQPEGAHLINWDGLDGSGHRISPGIYFIRLQAGDQVATRKIVLIR